MIAEFWDSRGRRLASQLTRELTPAQTVIWTALVIVMVLFPTIVHSSRFLDVAITYGIFAIALYGLGFLYGQTNYLSIAHSALMGVGGIPPRFCSSRPGSDSGPSCPWPPCWRWWRRCCWATRPCV